MVLVVEEVEKNNNIVKSEQYHNSQSNFVLCYNCATINIIVIINI